MTALSAKVSAENKEQDASGTDLSALFDQYFEVVEADTPELLDQVFRLRHKVYCVENPFEDPAAHPDGREKDLYDDHAVHAALIFRGTSQVMGCVRLILPDTDSPALALPVSELLDEESLKALNSLPLDRTAEISRYAVSKDFRRRKGEERYADVGFPYLNPKDERRIMPHVTLGLMRGALQLCRANGITHFCAVMEPSLMRLVARFGLMFQPIGPTVDYHGRRQPCFATLAHLDKGMQKRSKGFYDVVTRCVQT